MTVKSLLLVGALALSISGVASAKSYYFTLTAPAAAGSNELKPGEYEVKLQGAQAIVTEEAHGKSFTVPVKIEHSDKKFDDTAVECVNKDGKDSIQAISLGGSNTKIVLGQ